MWATISKFRFFEGCILHCLAFRDLWILGIAVNREFDKLWKCSGKRALKTVALEKREGRARKPSDTKGPAFERPSAFTREPTNWKGRVVRVYTLLNWISRVEEAEEDPGRPKWAENSGVSEVRLSSVWNGPLTLPIAHALFHQRSVNARIDGRLTVTALHGPRNCERLQQAAESHDARFGSDNTFRVLQNKHCIVRTTKSILPTIADSNVSTMS